MQRERGGGLLKDTHRQGMKKYAQKERERGGVLLKDTRRQGVKKYAERKREREMLFDMSLFVE